MVGVAQLVRVSDCGPEGRGFDPHHPPSFLERRFSERLFFCVYFNRSTKEHKKIFFSHKLHELSQIYICLWGFVWFVGFFFEHKFPLIIRKFFVSIVLIYDWFMTPNGLWAFGDKIYVYNNYVLMFLCLCGFYLNIAGISVSNFITSRVTGWINEITCAWRQRRPSGFDCAP